MRLFIIAWQFLTVIPIQKGLRPRGKELGSSMAFFPLVGIILGGVLALFDLILQGALPLEIRSIIIIACLAIITGANHLDGFADTVDGIMGGRNRGEALKIMRDSRVGAEGAVGLVLLILMKYLCLSHLYGQGPLAATPVQGDVRAMGLISMTAASRWAMVLMAYVGPFARKTGQGRAFVESMHLRALTAATGTAIVGVGLLMGLKGLVILCLVGVVAILSTLYFRRRLGGITGDTLGALNEVSELLLLIGAVGVQ